MDVWLQPLIATISLAAGIWLLLYWFSKPKVKPNTAAKMMIATRTFTRGY